MTDHIRELLQEESARRELPVNYKGRDYIVAGEADANTLGDSILQDKNRVEQQAKHYGNLIRKKIDPKIMRQVLLIHKTLQPPEGAEPYSLIDLCRLSTKQAGLIFALSKAAAEVLGIDGLEDEKEVPIEDETVAKVALKNLDGAKPDSESTSSATAA